MHEEAGPVVPLLAHSGPPLYAGHGVANVLATDMPVEHFLIVPFPEDESKAVIAVLTRWACALIMVGLSVLCVWSLAGWAFSPR
jgi:hypothetical protein